MIFLGRCYRADIISGYIGIARFRLYGNAVPVFPSDPEAIIDLAHVSSGGLAVSCSDQHYSTKDNLLLPGRGGDMGDGWETKRSRQPGHQDWVIVKLVVYLLHFSPLLRLAVY